MLKTSPVTTARRPVPSALQATPSTSRESAGGASSLGSAPLAELLNELDRRLAAIVTGHKVYLGTRDAADFLGISERLLYDLTAPRGPIPSIKIGGRLVKYDKADLIAAMDHLKSAAVAE